MNAEPNLAPPGAGLPKVELFVARIGFAFSRAISSRESVNARFQRERETIARLVKSLDADLASQRVLIARPRGLEDSSRYWSLWMTLEHLRMVHHGITRTIQALAAGIAPKGSASTAAVKPGPDVNATVVEEYEKSCDRLLVTAKEIDDLRTNVRYAHPWFGALDAAGWHALSASHLGIHRVQIERIAEQLRTAARSGKPVDSTGRLGFTLSARPS